MVLGVGVKADGRTESKGASVKYDCVNPSPRITIVIL